MREDYADSLLSCKSKSDGGIPDPTSPLTQP